MKWHPHQQQVSSIINNVRKILSKREVLPSLRIKSQILKCAGDFSKLKSFPIV
jgi:hypothetical protein